LTDESDCPSSARKCFFVGQALSPAECLLSALDSSYSHRLDSMRKRFRAPPARGKGQAHISMDWVSAVVSLAAGSMTDCPVARHATKGTARAEPSALLPTQNEPLQSDFRGHCPENVLETIPSWKSNAISTEAGSGFEGFSNIQPRAAEIADGNNALNIFSSAPSPTLFSTLAPTRRAVATEPSARNVTFTLTTTLKPESFTQPG
jgi:hypothetical protein